MSGIISTIFKTIINIVVCSLFTLQYIFVKNNKALWNFEYMTIAKWRKIIVVFMALSLSMLPWKGLSFDNSVLIFEPSSIIQPGLDFDGHLSFVHDSSKIIAFGMRTLGNKISVWDVKTRKSEPSIMARREVRDVAFSNDGQYMAIGWRRSWNPTEKDVYLELLDLKTNEIIELQRKEPFDKERYLGINAVAFSNDSKYLALLLVPDTPSNAFQRETANSIIEIWDAGTWELIKNIKGPSGSWPRNLIYSPDGKYLVTDAEYRKGICIWDIATGSLYKTFAQENWIRDIIFNPDGRYIAAGVSDGVVSSIKIWDIKTLKVVRTLPSNYQSDGNFIAFSPDGNYLAVIDYNAVKIWNMKTGLVAKTLSHPEKLLQRGLAYSPDGRYIAAGGEKYVKIWDVSEYNVEN